MSQSSTLASTPNAGTCADECAVLDSLRAFHEEEIRREQSMVLLAVEWARLNPAEEYIEPDDRRGIALLTPMEQMWQELAHRGMPHVDDLAIPAFAEAAGLTEFQAGKLLRESILLVALLPRVWERARCGQLEVWRARKLAEDCWGLTPDAIAYIDRNMALVTARHTEGGREGIIAEAKLRFMPEQAQAEEEDAKEERCVGVDWEDRRGTGIAALWGVLDIPDACDLEAAITAGAAEIKRLGSDAPLGVRRSWALGDLARASQLPAQQPLPNPILGAGEFYHPDCACQRGALPTGVAGAPDAMRPAWSGTGTPKSRVSVYLHLTPDAFVHPSVADLPGRHPEHPDGHGTPVPIHPGSGELPPIRVEGRGIPSGTVLSPETVKGWFTRPSAVPGPKVTFRPVVDLEDHHHVDAYEIPERIKEHVALRDGGCVFPWCHRKARNCDCDHLIAWKADGSGGPTCSCNLAPLCRRHHRAKTHADNHTGSRYTWWRYEALGEGRYLWKGPGGSQLLRTNIGVYDVSAEHVSRGPRTPDQQLPRTTLQDATSRAQIKSGSSSRLAQAVKVVQKIQAAPPGSSSEAIAPSERDILNGCLMNQRQMRTSAISPPSQ